MLRRPPRGCLGRRAQSIAIPDRRLSIDEGNHDSFPSSAGLHYSRVRPQPERSQRTKFLTAAEPLPLVSLIYTDLKP